MNRTGHQLLAGAAFAMDHHRRFGLGDVVDEFKEVLHGLRSAQNAMEAFIHMEGLAQGHDLLLLPHDLRHVCKGFDRPDDLTAFGPQNGGVFDDIDRPVILVRN